MKTNSILEQDLATIKSSIPIEMCRNKSFLVTGATGFMGKYLIKVLIYINETVDGVNCRIYALCRSREKARTVFGDENRHDLQLIIQDVMDPILISDEINYIFHTAGISTTPLFSTCPVDVISANVIGTYNLLQFVKKNKNCSLLFFSSGAVYGEIPEEIGIVHEEEAFLADMRKDSSVYMDSKRLGEQLCNAFWKQYGVAAKSVRIGHTYGPGIDLEDGHAYSDFVKSALLKENLFIKGDGTQSRSFCYITDAIIAYFKIMFYGDNGRAYNMSNPQETYSIVELANCIVNRVIPEMNLTVESTKDLKNFVSQKKTVMDISSLGELGWKPTISVEEGFKRTIQSFKEDKNDKENNE